jgi:hypothetical protein
MVGAFDASSDQALPARQKAAAAVNHRPAIGRCPLKLRNMNHVPPASVG